MAGVHKHDIDFLEDHALRARLFKISSEQQSLLSRDSAWSLSPSNIPNAILEHVSAHLVRRREAETAQHDAEPQGNGSLSSTRQSPIASEPARFESQSPESPRSIDHGEDHEDTAQSSVRSSWSVSPPHHMHPPGHATEHVRDEFVTQLPEDWPPQPTALRSSKLSRPSFEFPTSSVGQEDEDELEIDIPTRLEMPAVTTSRATIQLMATPPSAQIVPCSLEPAELRTREPARPRSRAGTKQTRYVPVTALYRPTKHVETTTDVANGASKASLELGDNSQLNTFPVVSSSIVPSTHQGSSHEETAPLSLPQPRETDCRKSVEPIEPPELPETRVASPQPPMRENDVLHSTDEAALPQSAALPTVDPVSRTEPPAKTLGLAKHESPYVQFRGAYKDYKGSAQSFVTACIYIQLQHKKIRSSLYDDFIRAWHDGYYAYVKECDSAVPPVPVMHAYAWYNAMDDDPLYNSRVITKKNLESTLDAFPEEVKIARRSLGIAQEEKDPFRRPEKAAVAEAPREEQPSDPVPPVEAPSLTKDTAHEDIPKQPQVAVPRSPDYVILEDSQVELPPMDFSKSMSEIDMKRQQPAARSLVRSYSEAANHKRKASVEMVERQVRRAPMAAVRAPPHRVPAPPSPSQVSIRPRESRGSPTGSLASVDFRSPSSTDARKRRYGNDPEKRREQFRKFLIKQKNLTANETIMSSAPTSAQRH